MNKKWNHYWCKQISNQKICNRWYKLSILFSCFQIRLRNYCSKFRACYENTKKRQFYFANFSKNMALTEKRRYATTKPMKNATKLSIQNFDFQNFVTEIFSFKIHSFLQISKIEKSWKWQTLNQKISVTKIQK